MTAKKVPESPRGLDPLVDWYLRIRRDLPWRKTRNPYSVWVSETMLQQTRVETAVPYFERFIAALPTVQALAEAPEERVLALWSGLGYYRRARMLWQAARRVVKEHDGVVPGEVEQLRALDGVGRYTAGAIASIAFGRRAPIVDGNVARVLARVFAIEDDVKSAAGSRRIWELAESLVAETRADPGDFNQALMELGATTCTPRNPACATCPIAGLCDARAQGRQGELPRVTAQREPRVVHRVVLVIASDDSVVVARRRGGGLFAGLWEPPGVDGDEDAGRALARTLGVPTGSLSEAGHLVHVLSHRKLVITAMRAPMPKVRRWPLPGPDYDAIENVALLEFATYPHSTLARKILTLATVAKVPGRGLRSKR